VSFKKEAEVKHTATCVSSSKSCTQPSLSFLPSRSTCKNKILLSSLLGTWN